MYNGPALLFLGMRDISHSEEEILRGQWEPGSKEDKLQDKLMADLAQEMVEDAFHVRRKTK